MAHCEPCLAYLRPSLQMMHAPEEVDVEVPAETGDLYDAALRELAEKLAGDFLTLSVKREALAAVLVLREACRKGKVTVEGIAKIAAYLRDLDRRPGGALPPPTLADL